MRSDWLKQRALSENRATFFKRMRIGENVNVTTVRFESPLFGRDFVTNFNMGLSLVQLLPGTNVNLA